ncbi:MAG: Uroporphyrinogen decarboxylase [Promethearchaeota archaeon]|nr:MAG: Uroporphyrinogen decarboxylase [Candidatus Lokiarchaeota archaeon]
MDAQERVLKAINHEEPDKVPAFESTITNNGLKKYYGIEIEKSEIQLYKSLSKLGKKGDRLLQKGYCNKNIVKSVMRNFYEFCKRAHLDLVLSMGALFNRKLLENGEGFIDEFGRIMKFESYVDKNGIETVIVGYHGSVINSFEDYESWEQPDPNWEARLINFEAGREVQEEMNNRVFSIPAISALMEVTWESFGLENFSKLFARSAQIKKVFDDRGKFTLELVKILAEHDAKIILLWDDYGYKNGLFMSPRNYRKYVFPWIKRICDAAHRMDCKIMLHSDGDLTEILDDIVNSGVDVLNPIEPTTANPDYTICNLKEKYGDKLTLSGNISPMLLASGPIQEIISYSKRLIKEIAPGGGFLFGSGHSINPAIPPQHYEAMQQIKEQYGSYPIDHNF